ncbi:MAG: hypothetical protein GY906_22690 [bacterium]|nr:hypothetical protein [bacterium]
MDDPRNTGYIRIHRKIRESPLWTQLKPGVLKLALHYIMEARWQPSKFYDGSRQIPVPAGSFVSSVRKLAEDTGLTVKQVRVAMQHLANLEFAAHTRAQSKTLITVTNYSSYQIADKPEGTHSGKRGANGGQMEGKRGANEGHTKEERKEGEEREQRRTAPPHDLCSRFVAEYSEVADVPEDIWLKFDSYLIGQADKLSENLSAWVAYYKHSGRFAPNGRKFLSDRAWIRKPPAIMQSKSKLDQAMEGI